ncbi:MAG: YihY/virulence factor BrkB family protein [Balneolaceae bacterium]|nr:YihY/virulence factor BrkB family protein [Balneolaceae bacterium]
MSLKFFKDARLVIRKAGSRFNDNDPLILAGALAFFSIFAAPPILISIIFLVGLFTGQEFASQEVFQIIQTFAGEAATELIQNIITNYFVEGVSLLQHIISIIIFLFAASTYFIIIQRSLNQIWQVRAKSGRSILRILKDRMVSFILIAVMGVVLILSLVLEAVLVYLSNNLDYLIPGVSPILVHVFGYLVSFLAVMFILGIIYKFLPDVVIEWEVVWVGAAVTSFLFSLGKLLITFGLTHSNIQNMYGTAGSTAIFLLWVFYSSLILFFGAEITQQYSREFAETIQPKDHAVKIVTHEAEKDYIADEQ